MVHSAAGGTKTPTSARSFSQLPTKLPKNMDSRDLTLSGKLSEEFCFIYRISMESMTGLRELDYSEEETISFRNSSSDEESSRSEVGVSMGYSGRGGSNGALHRLDYIHPLSDPDHAPIFARRSFQEEHYSANKQRAAARRHPQQLQRRCASYGAGDGDMPPGCDGGSSSGGSRKGGARVRSRLAPVQSLDSDDESGIHMPSRSVPSPSLHHHHHHGHHHSPHGTRARTPQQQQQHPAGGTPAEAADSPPPLPPRGIRHTPPPGVSSSPQPQTPPLSSAYDRLPIINTIGSSPPLSKLRRSRKVLTSRQSLDTSSRWLHPSLSSPDGRHDYDDQPVDHPTRQTGFAGHITAQECGQGSRAGYSSSPCYGRGLGPREVLGQLENVVYGSPDGSTLDDFLFSSNYTDTPPDLTGEKPRP